MQKSDLFGTSSTGAYFSPDRKFRYALWRIWDESLPLVMFIGLNPSTANETDLDPTTKRVMRIAKSNGFGGYYMMNCFPLVSTNPDDLKINLKSPQQELNNMWLKLINQKCRMTVFAWGNFKIVRDSKRDIELFNLFPMAKALEINKNGSPKHPLYCKANTKFIEYIL